MALSVGSKAPDFTVSTLGASGPELFKLSEHVGQSNILLLFVPMAFTGVCTKELCEISSGINAYKTLSAEVYGISGDNPFAQKAWAEKENITLQLLSDYDHKVTEAYGVAYESFLPAKNLIMGGVAKRSAFVIDKAGVIQYAEVLESPGDLPDFTAIQAKLKELA
jgi:peroxiredoxin